MHPHPAEPNTSDLRAADIDRHQVIAELTQHTAAGRLTLDEFTARTDAVTRAKTYRDLAAVTADLPTAGATSGSRSGTRHTPPPGTALAMAAVVLVVLIAGIVLAGMAGWSQMGSMMASMTTAMGCG